MREAAPVLWHELSSLIALLKTNSKAEKRLALIPFLKQMCCSNWGMARRPAWLALWSQTAKLQERDKTEEKHLSCREKQDRNRWALPLREAKKEAVDPKKWGTRLGQYERKMCCQFVNYKLFSVYAEESEDDGGVPKVILPPSESWDSDFTVLPNSN